MAMATQHATPARHNRACAWLRLRPNGRIDGVGAPAFALADGEGVEAVGVAVAPTANGGRARMRRAISGIVTRQNTPRPMYVWRHPATSTKCCTIGGQTAPAR